LSYLFTNFKNEILSLLSGFLIGSLIKIWPFRNILESRINSEGEIEAVVTRPEFPNLDNLDQIIFFIAFSIVGYVLISFLQKKSLKDNKE
jgi:putative membrane protein